MTQIKQTGKRKQATYVLKQTKKKKKKKKKRRNSTRQDRDRFEISENKTVLEFQKNYRPISKLFYLGNEQVRTRFGVDSGW